MRKLLLVVILMLVGCMDDASKRELERKGYTNVTITGPAMFNFKCGKNNGMHNEFSATNPSGKRVTGVLCMNLWTYVVDETEVKSGS